MSTDTPSSSRTRRRYMPGSARSKTIELGTLSEIEEDLYQNRKDLTEPSCTKDDSFVGTLRKPSRGSVKAIARSLSEKYRAAAAARQNEQRQENENDIKVEHEPKILKTRQFAEEMGVTRSLSLRRDVRTDRQPSEGGFSVDPPWTVPRPTPSEFHPRPPSAISRHGSIIAGPSALSRSSSMAGRMLIYDPRTMSLVDPALPHTSKYDLPIDGYFFRMPDYPVPVWIPPPSSMYIPLGAPVLSFPQKMLSTKRNSTCSEVCCGGVAQLLWTIISIILVGFILVLILALFWV